jgi:putative membrane-bound dehydrogenase-like protein
VKYRARFHSVSSRWPLGFVVLATMTSAALNQTPVRPGFHQISLNGHTFTLPDGFTIEQAAGPPQVNRPITADFDEKGRLYVADSSGSNEKLTIQLEKKPHRIVRLSSTKSDGHFDQGVVFADKLNFPEGTMWYGGSLYVSAVPSIWKLTDTKGTGVADQREEWFLGKTMTGCGNDLHGPYRGPDGWIYWCKGAFAQQTYERPGKPPFKTRASHVFRCRPDGTGLEPVMTGGMDNPVDLVFTPGGERVITTTFFQYPAGGKRDGLIHIVYGGIYGKDYDPIYEHPWTGPTLMPVLTHMGPAAPCGLHRYENDAFGPEYKDNIFACQFNLQKVSRHVLDPEGATFVTRDEDFVVSDKKDFHPTDVLEDADGSLLIVDTGGWYKLCCPSSQLVKPDVLGAIYRVRRVGAPRVKDPRGLQLDWKDMPIAGLAKRLDDRRPAVRRRAMETLANRATGRAAPVVAALGEIVSNSPSAQARRNAVWTATRIDEPSGRLPVRAALRDKDESVRQAALHSISLLRDREAVGELLEMLKADSLHNRRAAAEALGRIGDKNAGPHLLAALSPPSDRVLEHSLTYALMEIGDREGIAAGLKSPHAAVRRAALTALDQMPSGKITVEPVVAELSTNDAKLKETAWWIAGRHVEWGSQVSGFLRDRLRTGKLSSAEREDLVQQLARLARSPAIQKLLADQVADAGASPEARALALQAMARAGLKEAPASWLSSLKTVLPAKKLDLTREAAATARALHWPKDRPKDLLAALDTLILDEKVPSDTRLLAMAAVPDGLRSVDPALFQFLSHAIRADEPVATRSLAADVLSRAHLDHQFLMALAEAMPSIGPLDLDRALEPFGRANDDAVGQKLLAGLKASPAKTALRPDALQSRLAKYSPAIRKQADELLASLHADLAKQRAHLEATEKTLPPGDIRRGQLVFNSPKAACISCHTIGYVGGKIGPDLTRIGSIRNERDLLESILFPSMSFVRGYEPMLVETRAGKTFNGVVKSDSPTEIVLVLGADQEIRLAKSEIEELRPGQVSIMPAGLDQQLSLQDLADVVTFLKACR